MMRLADFDQVVLHDCPPITDPRTRYRAGRRGGVGPLHCAAMRDRTLHIFPSESALAGWLRAQSSNITRRILNCGRLQ